MWTSVLVEAEDNPAFATLMGLGHGKGNAILPICTFVLLLFEL
jgi:hypothetical protein